MLLDLRTDHLKIAQDILQKFVPERAVWAFGSRAKWTAKEYSDLDLCIVGKTPLSFRTLGLLQEAFEDSDLPYKVDVVDWATTSDSFRKIIEQDMVVVQRAAVGRVSAKRVTRQEPDAVASGDASVPEDVGLRCANPTYGGEWRSSTLGGFVRIQRGHDLTASEQQTGDIPIMGSAGQNGTHSIALANGPGVVVGRSGASAGRVHFSAVDYWPHNTCLYVTDFLGNNPRFAYYLLQTLDLASFNSGSAQPSLNRNFLYAIPVRIPPRLEQDYIVALLQSLDDRITLLRETNATLEAIAQALFKSWFVDFDPVRAKLEGRAPEGMDEATARLFPDSFQESELGLVPKGWHPLSVSEGAEIVKGKSYSSKDLVTEHETALVTLKSFTRGGGFRLDGFKPYSGAYKASQVVVSGDLIVAYTDVTQAAELIGKPAIVIGVDEHKTLVASLDVGIIRPLTAKVSRQFLYGLFNTDAFQAHTLSHTSGTTVLHLSKDGVGSYRFVCPPISVVEAFSIIAESLTSRQQVNIDQMRNLATLRDTLLPRLISGQLRL